MNAERPHLLAVGLNPAWQKTLFFPEFQAGEVNRATRVTAHAGGKGIHCAYAVQQAGGRVTVAQFAGGVTGDWLLQDLAARQFAHLTASTAVPTRTCTTLIGERQRSMTELIEPAGAVQPHEATLLRQRLLAALPDVDGVALCGTFPPGVTPDFYAAIAAAARPHAVVLLDACKNILPVLEAGVDILKINAAELAELTGEADVAQGARALFARYPVAWLAVTAGPRRASLFCAASRPSPDGTVPAARGCRGWSFELPTLPDVCNPLGAGDCTAGVLLWQLVRPAAADLLPGPRSRLSDAAAVTAAFAVALAAASASCTDPEPARFSAARATAIRQQIVVRELERRE